MFKNSKKLILVTCVIILLPIIAGLLLWNRLPDEIATHFGADNQPDGYSSKAFTVFGLPAILFGVHLLCIFATNADPKGMNIGKKILPVVLWICPFISIVTTATIYAYSLGVQLNIGFICCILLGIIFIVLGNYLPKCKQNYTVGIKIPWTLNNESNWYHTHRLAGWCMSICGIITIICAFLNAFIFIGISIALSVIIPIVYSYYYYRKHK